MFANDFPGSSAYTATALPSAKQALQSVPCALSLFKIADSNARNGTTTPLTGSMHIERSISPDRLPAAINDPRTRNSIAHGPASEAARYRRTPNVASGIINEDTELFKLSYTHQVSERTVRRLTFQEGALFENPGRKMAHRITEKPPRSHAGTLHNK